MANKDKRFPKPIMTLKELEDLGYSVPVLRKMYHDVGYPLAFKEGGLTSTIKFNTDELDKHLRRLNERRV